MTMTATDLPVQEMSLAHLRGFVQDKGLDPATPVRLLFRSEEGKTGVYVTTAGKADSPNASDRFFPDHFAGETPANLGWGNPWWYAQECYNVIILEGSNRND